jgi:putative DNA primase/helicase
MNAPIDIAGIPALREIRTAELLGPGDLRGLIKQAAPDFVASGLSPDDALACVEQALGEREPSLRLGKRRPEALAFLRSMMERTVYAVYAPGLVDKGYSPVPRIIKDGHGRPTVKGWSDYSERQPSEEEIAAWSRIKGADISLACGYGGLIAIDVDTDDPEILAAVIAALPHCIVARRGSKGFVLLCRRADGPQKTLNIYRNDEARSDPLVEIMGLGRVIAIAPSIHAKTGKPYQWIDPATGKPHPADWQLPRVDKLPLYTNENQERLIAALKPWSRKPKTPRPKAEGPAAVLTDTTQKRYRTYALAGLERATAGLAALRDGRPTELFRAVCGLGWAVAHRVLTEAEFMNAFATACETNGLAARDGRRAIEASIHSGLQKAAHNPLPQLEDRPRDHKSDPAAPGNGGGAKNASAPGPKAAAGDGGNADRKPSAAEVEAGDCVYRTASEIPPEPVEWLWKERYPNKRLSVLTGPPGLGKSQATIYMAAIVTKGGKWPDGAPCEVVGDVIFLSAEDSPEDTIVPRLMAAGADLSCVHVLEAVREPDPETGEITERLFSLAFDVGRLEKLIRKTKAKLVVVDPISAYLGEKTDSHSNSSVRGLLAPLAKMAHDCEAAVIAVTHDRKSGGKASERTIGSVAFTAAPRVAWGVTPELDEDGTPTGRSIMTRLKGNLAEDVGGLAYEIETVILPDPRFPEGIKTSRVKWHEGAILKTADELYEQATAEHGEGEKLSEAREWLAEILEAKPEGVDGKWLKERARESSISERTLDRAAVKLGVVKQSQGFGKPRLWTLMCAKDPHVRPSNQGLAERAHMDDVGAHEPLTSVKQPVFEGEI